MKPFFTNPFKPLITRTGTAIGKAAERTMLQAVDGPGGIRKRFQTNPDGSTTMLHTQNGLARFKTDGNGRSVFNEFTINDANFNIDNTLVGLWADHTFHHTPQNATGTFRMWITNILGIPGLQIVSLSDGFTISGDVVTIPDGFLWHPATVHVHAPFWEHAEDHVGQAAYKIHIGPTRKNNKPDVFGLGTLTGI